MLSEEERCCSEEVWVEAFIEIVVEVFEEVCEEVLREGCEVLCFVVKRNCCDCCFCSRDKASLKFVIRSFV